MADKDIKISIKTTADTSGVDKADASVKRLNGTVSVGTVQGFLDSTADKARVSEMAFYDLDAAVGKAAVTNQTYTAGQTQMQQGTRNSSAALLMFSQGLEDAQYGIRGVLNNIPGLVLALGGTAGIAGAVSIAAVSFSVLYDWLGKTEEKASDVADRIDQISRTMGEVEEDRFKKVADDLDLARESAEALKVEYSETRKAEQAYALGAIDNATKIKQANDNIAEAMGRQVDQQKQLVAMAEAEEAKRRLLAEQAIAAENDKAQKAQEEASKQADILADVRLRNQDEAANLVILRGQVQALRDQEDALKKLAEQRTTDDPGLQLLGAVFPKVVPRTPAAITAQKTLDSEGFQVEKSSAEAQLAKLEKLVETLANTEPRAENALKEAQQKAQDVQAAVETNIQQIQKTLAADQLLAQSETVVKSSEKFASDLTNAFSQVKTSTAAGESALQGILSAAASGNRITSEELPALLQNLTILIGQLQGGVAGVGDNTGRLIEIATGLQLTVTTQGRQIQELQKSQIQISRDATR